MSIYDHVKNELIQFQNAQKSLKNSSAVKNRRRNKGNVFSFEFDNRSIYSVNFRAKVRLTRFPLGPRFEQEGKRSISSITLKRILVLVQLQVRRRQHARV